MKNSNKLKAIIVLMIVACMCLAISACGLFGIEKVENSSPADKNPSSSVVDGDGSVGGTSLNPGGNSSTGGDTTSQENPNSSKEDQPNSSKEDQPNSSKEETSSSEEDSSSSKEDSSSTGGGSSDTPTPGEDKNYINISDYSNSVGKVASDIVSGVWTIQTDPVEVRSRKRTWAKTGYSEYDYIDTKNTLDGKTDLSFTYSIKLASDKGLKVNVPSKGYLALYVENGSTSATSQAIKVNGKSYAIPLKNVVQVVVAVEKGEYVVTKTDKTLDLYYAELFLEDNGGGTDTPTPVTEYTFTFETNGGSNVESITAEKLTSLPTCTKDGYKFVGWYEKEDLSGNAVTVPYAPNKNVTLYAKWEKESTVDPTPTPTQEVKSYINISDYSNKVGEVTSEIVNGVWAIQAGGVDIRSRNRKWTKTGYSEYNYIDTKNTLDGKTELSFSYSIRLQSSTGLKVNVPGKGYLALYVENGSTSATSQAIKVNGVSYAIPLKNVVQVVVAVEKGEYFITKTDKTVDLYYAELYCEGNGGTVEPQPTTKYTFTFETNGGSKVESVTAEKLTSLPNCTKDGYKFLGWYEKEDLSGNAITVPYAPNKNVTLYAKWEKETTVDPTPTPTKYTYTFEPNGGSYVESVTAEKLTSLPTCTKDGYKFVGWFDNQDLVGNPITVPYTANKNVTLYAKWEAVTPSDTQYLVEAKGLSETAYVVWKDTKASSAKAYYKKTSATNYTEVDSELIRDIGNGEARVDILGLAAGTYDVKITVGSAGKDFVCENITVNSYDRSGYAHFGYTKGVGAYNDDGTLKSDVKVIYITEATKNSAGGGVVKALQSGNICVRIIGKVTTDTRKSASSWEGKYTKISGLKDTSSGSEGSTWGLCEVQGKSNITFEGVGSDAEIYQWGVSFKRCNSVEVRNLTFTNYPEDACEFNGGSNGEMEQYGNYWVHNNVFNQGMRLFDDSADQDKKEGDGAIDLKYCHNATYSYNKVANCHKTGLIGGSDSNQQKNITFHHNYFYKNSSRMPLGRTANMHYYNNYYESIGGTCMSIRGNGYVFSEGNYFYKCKNPFEVKAGAIKSFNDKLDGCSGAQNQKTVTDRTAKVSNSCIFGSTFDTDSNNFYYDSSKKVSNVRYLTSAEQAKTDCVALAGPGKANK